MAHPNEEVARRTSDALASGDMETFLGMHAEDAVVHIPGKGPGSGDHRGREALGRSFQTLAGVLDGPPAWAAHDILANDEHVVVIGVQTLSRGGRSVENRLVVVGHVRDGKLSETWLHPADEYGIDAFLS